MTEHSKKNSGDKSVTEKYQIKFFYVHCFIFQLMVIVIKRKIIIICMYSIYVLYISYILLVGLSY